MHPLLKTRIGVPSLASFCIALGILWVRSIYLAGRYGKDDDIGLFWASVLFYGPVIGIIFSCIIFTQFRTGAFCSKPWAIAGIVGGLCPMIGCIMLLLFA